MTNLEELAKDINNASDALGKEFIRINEHLKKLNIGFEVWVHVNDHIEVGYTKVGKEWGLAVTWDEQTWLANEAPRFLRIKLAKHMPEILEAFKPITEAAIKRIHEASESLKKLEL